MTGIHGYGRSDAAYMACGKKLDLHECQMRLLKEEFIELEKYPTGYASSLVQYVAKSEFFKILPSRGHTYEQIVYGISTLPKPDKRRKTWNDEIINGLRNFIYTGLLPDQQHNPLDEQNSGKFKRLRVDDYAFRDPT